MNRYHVNCPYCGHWNENLFLEETDGTFECEACGQVTHLEKFRYGELPMFEWDEMLKKNPEMKGIYERHNQRKAS